MNSETLKSIIERHPGQWDDISWQPPALLGFEKYEHIFEDLRSARQEIEEDRSTLLWWLGDLLVNGENALGETVNQLFLPTHMTKESMVKIRRTAEEFPKAERWSPLGTSKPTPEGGEHYLGISFWTHWDVRRLGRKDRARLLKRYATDENYSRDDLRADVRALIKEQANDKQDKLFDESGAEDLVACPVCSEGHIPKDQRDHWLALESELRYLQRAVANTNEELFSEIYQTLKANRGEGTVPDDLPSYGADSGGE